MSRGNLRLIRDSNCLFECEPRWGCLLAFEQHFTTGVGESHLGPPHGRIGLRRVEALLGQRLVVNATGPTTLRLLPPLTIAEDDLDEGLTRLALALGS